MEVSSERQAIPIADLGVDQLSYFQRQLDQEIAFLTESLKSRWKTTTPRPVHPISNAIGMEPALHQKSLELKIFESKFIASEESVVNAAKVPSDGEILVPLTESMYLPAKIADPKNHLIEIGTGYFVEMSTEKAVDYFRRKQAFLKKQMEVIEGVLPEKYRARNAIVDNLQKKINLYCSQVQVDNVNIKK